MSKRRVTKLIGVAWEEMGSTLPEYPPKDRRISKIEEIGRNLG